MINSLLGQGCPLNYTKLVVIYVIFLTSYSNDLLFTDPPAGICFWGCSALEGPEQPHGSARRSSQAPRTSPLLSPCCSPVRSASWHAWGSFCFQHLQFLCKEEGVSILQVIFCLLHALFSQTLRFPIAELPKHKMCHVKCYISEIPLGAAWFKYCSNEFFSNFLTNLLVDLFHRGVG